jgi:hypothetical protein
MQHMCKAFNIKKTFSSSYHPQGNGQVERLNSRILQAASVFCSTISDEWDLHLPALQFALRTTPRYRTGIAPFFAVHCREPMLPYEVLMGTDKDRALHLHEDVEKRLSILAKSREIVDAAYDKYAHELEKRNKSQFRVIRVAVGDYVMVQQEPVKAKNGKLGPRWTGPWCLEQQADSYGVTYVCRLQGRHVTRRTIHVTRMKKYKQRPVHLEPDDSSKQNSSPNDNIQQLIDRILLL